mgnify:CR=1 FL=1
MIMQKYMKKTGGRRERNIKIVGIVQPAEGSKATALNMGIGYPYSLMTHVAEEAKNSEIVKQQKASPDINVFTGEKFGEDSGDNGLDMNSLFSVDEDALQKHSAWEIQTLQEVSEIHWTFRKQ